MRRCDRANRTVKHVGSMQFSFQPALARAKAQLGALRLAFTKKKPRKTGSTPAPSARKKVKLSKDEKPRNKRPVPGMRPRIRHAALLPVLPRVRASPHRRGIHIATDILTVGYWPLAFSLSSTRVWAIAVHVLAAKPSQKPEANSRKPEANSQKPEARSKKPEDNSKKKEK